MIDNTWRLIKTSPASGAWNMAVDEAILEAVGRGEVPTTLRLYAWEPACLSLGYAQPISDVDIDRLKNNGWDLVRRMTGGRAILHVDELTYAVVGPQNDPRLAGGVLESYRRLSQALLAALLYLGLKAQALPKPQNQSSTNHKNDPVCFEVPSNYEITVDGKKLIGSAQARKKQGVLQHGTLPLFGDLSRITQVLIFPNETERKSAAERLELRATSIEGVLKQNIGWKAAAAAFESAFKKSLNINFLSEELTPGELAHAKELADEKYSQSSWTARI